MTANVSVCGRTLRYLFIVKSRAVSVWVEVSDVSVRSDPRHGHLVGGGCRLADRVLLDDRVVVRGRGDDGRYQLVSVTASLISNGSLWSKGKKMSVQSPIARHGPWPTYLRRFHLKSTDLCGWGEQGSHGVSPNKFISPYETYNRSWIEWIRMD
ncbi:hypothetical protein AVEN_194183-1 [Araneus ventricosus]|uniref:Uncharacterized protein n=1 Tax=Araneus ventricosus TaxID=182803 RepID=A0A4Y2NI10_ARAVE|nr:hypothetical protein AVEN_194183-1 [Araneus ventricosus]